jgi:hypothetical protein
MPTMFEWVEGLRERVEGPFESPQEDADKGTFTGGGASRSWDDTPPVGGGDAVVGGMDDDQAAAREMGRNLIPGVGLSAEAAAHFRAAKAAADSGDVLGAMLEMRAAENLMQGAILDVAGFMIAPGARTSAAAAKVSFGQMVMQARRLARESLRERQFAERAANIANIEKHKAALLMEEASSPFLANGELHPDVVSASMEIMPGTRLRNPELIRRLTSDGSDISEWSKMETQAYRSPGGQGPFRVHFYRNQNSGSVMFDLDYKAVFDHQGKGLRK